MVDISLVVGIICTDGVLGDGEGSATTAQSLPLKVSDVDCGVLSPCSLMQNIVTIKR